MNSTQKQIEAMIAKSAKAEKSEDAVRFSQAALNAAHAARALMELGLIPGATQND
jgi:hypothetical protein